MSDLMLVTPNEDYLQQIDEYREEFLKAKSSMDGTSSLRRDNDPMEFIKNCELCRNESTVPEGLVPATQLMLVRKSDNKLLGMLQIRHYFNTFLEKFGGHI